MKSTRSENYQKLGRSLPTNLGLCVKIPREYRHEIDSKSQKLSKKADRIRNLDLNNIFQIQGTQEIHNKLSTPKRLESRILA